MTDDLNKLKHLNTYLDDITKLSIIKHSTRAVSEVIVSLLLLAITVIGGIFVFTVFNGTDFGGDLSSSTTSAQKSSGSIKITGFDTRDGTGLFGISGLDNDNNNDGLEVGEYIVLKVRNDSPNTVFLENVQINEISHSLDGSITSSVVTSPPSAGTYSIIPVSDVQEASSVELGEGREVRLVVSLSGSVGTIDLNKSIRIAIDSGGFDPTTFIIPSGSAR